MKIAESRKAKTQLMMAYQKAKERMDSTNEEQRAELNLAKIPPQMMVDIAKYIAWDNTPLSLIFRILLMQKDNTSF